MGHTDNPPSGPPGPRDRGVPGQGALPSAEPILYNAPILGRSVAFLRIHEQIGEAARSNCSTLFLGESGGGKSRHARELHELGPRRHGPFIICGVGNLPEPLAQSQLFGHKRGVFTGANEDQVGLLQTADHGDILFDDVDKFPLFIQPMFLRFLDDHRICPLGATTATLVNVRVLAATNQDLKQLVAKGLFLKDLMNRLGDIVIHIPPLRERREDIQPLVEYLLKAYALEQQRPVSALDPEALAMLEGAHWPGNVRDIAKAVLHCVLRANGGRITPEIVAGAPGLQELQGGPIAELARLGQLTGDERRSKPIIERALELTRGRGEDAAVALRLSLRTFQRECKRHEIRLRKGR
jgi:DNA-binding NtrC family response regulator